MNRKGFTLIELLVVIAIIAILAAILFPVFARARAKAMQTTCLSNVKNIMLALHMYTSDYGDMYMPMGINHGCNGVNDNIDLLNPYIKNSQIWLCPSLTPAEASAVAIGPNLAHGNWGYVWNGYDDTWDGQSEGRVANPASIVAMGDGYSGYYMDIVEHGYLAAWGCLNSPNVGLTATVPYWPNNGCWGATSECFEARHSGMANFGFLDGHAKALALDPLGVNPGHFLNATP